MKKSFVLGAVSGAVALVAAVPLLAQLSLAQTSGASSSAAFERSVPSQECVQAMVTLEESRIASMDTMEQARKTAQQAHVDALKAAAAITDDTARQTAIREANDAMRAAMKNAATLSDDEKAAMEALQTACGNDRGMMGFGFGMMERGDHMGPDGKGQDRLAEKLGMTADELKSALDSGKTIEEIAQEKGVTLPARHDGEMRGGMHFGRGPADDSSGSGASSEQ